jgi:hypothetical protein
VSLSRARKRILARVATGQVPLSANGSGWLKAALQHGVDPGPARGQPVERGLYRLAAGHPWLVATLRGS